ncbi:MAG: response regulator [Pseudomonadales bacterium]
MTRYRALVVDDSPTARQSLAQLLAGHDLAVDFAASGEEALEFLRGQLVDVIFMDHTMPGMSGLEAVSAIKSNPRTATIPVMMYTTKEGEVYVGQARALGAVGVLPKEVQPGVLFDMLHKLGLVTDRRDGAEPPQGELPRRRFDDLIDDVDREYEQRALGASVQALLTRMLEQQHAQLRADVQSSQRRFAKQVAAEILEQNQAAAIATGSAAGASRQAPAPAGSANRRRLLPSALALAVLLLGTWSWQLLASRDAALTEVARLGAAARQETAALADHSGSLSAALQAQRSDSAAHQTAALQALQWALNQSAQVPLQQPPFNASVANRLNELLAHLTSMSFQGEVVLTARLGRFCLARDDYGQWQAAAADLPAVDCELLGHPLQDAASLSALQSVEFAAAVAAVSAEHPGITVELRSTGNAAASDLALQYGWDRAGDWNQAAARDNRVEFAIGSATAGGAVAGLAQRL